MLAFDSIPDDLQVLHTCDNPACVRNDDEGFYELNGVLHPRRGHLWLGTHQENMADRDRKGRNVAAQLFVANQDKIRSKSIEKLPRGQDVYCARFTNDEVRSIRARYATGMVSQTELAEELDVWPQTISKIVRGETYKLA